MTGADALEIGRELLARQEWGKAFARLSEAETRKPLAAEDLERLATAAQLIGREAECTDAWTRAHATAYAFRHDLVSRPT